MKNILVNIKTKVRVIQLFNCVLRNNTGGNDGLINKFVGKICSSELA